MDQPVAKLLRSPLLSVGGPEGHLPVRLNLLKTTHLDGTRALVSHRPDFSISWTHCETSKGGTYTVSAMAQGACRVSRLRGHEWVCGRKELGQVQVKRVPAGTPLLSDAPIDDT